MAKFCFRIFSRVGDKGFLEWGVCRLYKAQDVYRHYATQDFHGLYKAQDKSNFLCVSSVSVWGRGNRVFGSEKSFCVIKCIFIGNVFCVGLTVKLDSSVLLYVLFIFATLRCFNIEVVWFYIFDARSF